MNNAQKVAVWLGAITTAPLAFVLGYFAAEPFYMRFMFKGERIDMAPGDAFGVLFYTFLFGMILAIPATLAWYRLYRGISASSKMQD